MTYEELVKAENDAYNAYLEAARASVRAREDEVWSRLKYEKIVAELASVEAAEAAGG